MRPGWHPATARGTRPAGYSPTWPARTGQALRRPPPDGSERFRLFESLTAQVTAAAAAAGLVVVLEDLQWVDPMSAMLLAHLGQGLPASRVLVVAAYRDQELGQNAPAQAAVSALVREPGTVQLRLAGQAEAGPEQYA